MLDASTSSKKEDMPENLNPEPNYVILVGGAKKAGSSRCETHRKTIVAMGVWDTLLAIIGVSPFLR